MKVFSLLVIIAVISSISSTLTGFTNKTCSSYSNKTDEDHQAFSKDFCRTLGVTSSTNKCCYVKRKLSNDRYYYNCIEITQAQFYDIKDTKDRLSSLGEIKNIICDSSSYLSGSLLLLLFFLF